MGIRASYTRPYDLERKHTIADKIFAFIMDKCDSIILYMEEVKRFWSNKELNYSKVFTAINTVKVQHAVYPERMKKDFLFIGTLYKQKGVDKLINCFSEVINSVHADIKLHIVGEGDQKEALMNLTTKLGINSNVLFYGALYDEIKISKLFSQSIICISPTQAGLSVPKSLGYGVPFITHKDAITGGEIYHINNGVNGIMYENQKDLKRIMFEAITNRSKFLEMGVNARNYYINKATPIHMAQGFIDAINYALAHK